MSRIIQWTIFYISLPELWAFYHSFEMEVKFLQEVTNMKEAVTDLYSNLKNKESAPRQFRVWNV